MKTLIIVLKDITENGGGERVCVNLANALRQYLANYRIIILSFFCANSTPTYNLNENIEVLYLQKGHAKPKNIVKKLYNRFLAHFTLNQNAHDIIVRNDADVVLANDGWFIPHHNNANIRYMRLWHLNAPLKNKRVFEKFHDLIVLSQKELDTWQSYHKNVSVIANFLPSIPKESTDYSAKVVLSVGRMTKEKGFLRLLDIWAIVHKANRSLADWKLHIVGEGVQKEEIEHKILALNLQGSVLIKPFNKNISKEYLQASIYVMTSIFEGFGMVLAEAASFGLPSISFDIKTGPSDIIEHEKSGFLVQDNDLEDFSQKLVALMCDQTLRHDMGVRAKEVVSEKFSKEIIIKKWEKLLATS